MTEIERKVIAVRQYIYNNKGVDIGDIKLVDGNDLDKLDYAYEYAIGKIR